MGFVRFVLVGGISAGVDAGLLWLLHGGFGVWLPAATFTGVVSSFGVNFLLNRGWTFGSGAPAGAQLLRYLLLAGTNWLVTVLAVTGLVALGLHYLVARFLVLGVMTVVNFLSYRAWVFRDPR
jgi:putative flippase GtrA